MGTGGYLQSESCCHCEELKATKQSHLFFRQRLLRSARNDLALRGGRHPFAAFFLYPYLNPYIKSANSHGASFFRRCSYTVMSASCSSVKPISSSPLSRQSFRNGLISK